MSLPPTTLQDVADLAQVSRPAASLALNGRGTLSLATRKRVFEAAKKLGYRPNPIASGLRRKRTNMIGVLWIFIGPHESSQLVRRFNECALANGYSALIHDTIGSASLIKSQLNEMIRLRVDGVILHITKEQEGDLLDLRPFLRRIPQVVVAADMEVDCPYAHVALLRERALQDATRHLVAIGRKSFGFIGSDSPCNRLKVDAIRSGLRELGRNEHIEFFKIDIPHAWKIAPEEVVKLFANSPATASLDALLASTDEFAACAITALRRMGRRVPEDIAVVGFNDTPIASFFDPPIASLERNDEHFAIRATERLIQNIKNPENPNLAVEKIEMQFVWRESAGCMPSNNPKGQS